MILQKREQISSSPGFSASCVIINARRPEVGNKHACLVRAANNILLFLKVSPQLERIFEMKRRFSPVLKSIDSSTLSWYARSLNES